MSSRTRVLVNGEPDDRISVLDRGFQYGDGVFETIAVRAGQPLLWERHVTRLGIGCERLGIPSPDKRLLREEAIRLCMNSERAVLKLMLTRGSSGRGYAPPASPQSTRALVLGDWPQYPAACPDQGVAVRLCEQRLSLNARLAGIKHLNRLEQVLARAEWGDDYAEGLMLNLRDEIVDGTMSNVFAVIDDTLVTPEIVDAGVAGVMRAFVLERAARLGIRHRIRPLPLAELGGAREMFLTNSLIGVWPVGRLEKRVLAVGPVTQALQRAIPGEEADASCA